LLHQHQKIDERKMDGDFVLSVKIISQRRYGGKIGRRRRGEWAELLTEYAIARAGFGTAIILTAAFQAVQFAGALVLRGRTERRSRRLGVSTSLALYRAELGME
jgi:hypothetical protein